MNWQVISMVLEIVSIITLIFSVFYLAKQVQIGNRQTVADSLSDAIKLYLTQYNTSYGTEESVAFMRKALNDYTSLSKDEKGRLFSIIISYIGAWDNLHTKYEAGFLPEATYNSITAAFSSLVRTPGGLACIEQIHKGFDLPPHMMDKTTITSIAGTKIKPFGDSLDFIKEDS